MKTTIFVMILLLAGFSGNSQTSNAGKVFEKDKFETNQGPLIITFIGHGTLMIEAGKTVIHIDPVSNMADYSTLPKADLILVTHEHGDHLDKKAIALITQSQTKIVMSKSCTGAIEHALILNNGDSRTLGDLSILAVPAYNIVNKRPDGIAYHPKGNGNGYVITYGGKRIYIGGDTENIPEMANLKNIDVAFLPMNLPYTMTPQMAADAAKSFMPTILYPYHMGETDPQLLVGLLKGSTIQVRLRQMK